MVCPPQRLLMSASSSQFGITYLLEKSLPQPKKTIEIKPVLQDPQTN